MYFEDPAYAQRDSASLRRLFADADPSQRCGFKRPELLSRPECPARIAEEVPGAKLVAVLREPISRSVSAYFHYMRAGVVPLAPLNVGLRQILRGEFDPDFPKAREIIDYSCYAQHLQRYYRLFERDAILVLLEDDLRHNSQTALDRVYKFLGVLPGFVPPRLGRQENAGVYSVTRLRLLRRGSRFIYRYRRGSPYVDLCDNWGTRGLYRAVRWVDRAVVAPFVSNEPPQLEEDVRAQLAQVFAPEVDRLETILERPLDNWRQKAA